MLIISTQNLAWISDIISCRLLPHWTALTAGWFRGYWGSKRLKMVSEIEATKKLQISRQVHHTRIISDIFCLLIYKFEELPTWIWR